MGSKNKLDITIVLFVIIFSYIYAVFRVFIRTHELIFNIFKYENSRAYGIIALFCVVIIIFKYIYDRIHENN